jgi:hypothetical protein
MLQRVRIAMTFFIGKNSESSCHSERRVGDARQADGGFAL